MLKARKGEFCFQRVNHQKHGSKNNQLDANHHNETRFLVELD
jgi:hypothetical protein